MCYDFTTMWERRGMDAIAIDAVGKQYPQPRDGFDPIPMWVADMNFPTCPAITEAIVQRAQHPLFGYFTPSKSYYRAIIQWQESHNGVTGLTPDHIGYENGVLGGVVSALNIFCSRGDPVLLHAPTYVGFTAALTDNGYHMVHSPLVQDGAGIYRMDLADMEQKIIKHRIHAAILCSPHNPTGRVWERWELEQAMELFARYDVMVVSDEIWSDLLLDGNRHIPTQSLSEDARQRTVAMYAPSKTFNLAGLVGSYHIIYNETLRDRMRRESILSHYNNQNVLSMHALIGAYSAQGEDWLIKLREVLSQNVSVFCDFVHAHFDGVQVTRPQGTYMLFLNCQEWCAAHHKTLDELLNAGWQVGVIWQDGRPFYGSCHIRVNVALPLARLEEALRRLDQYVFNAG